MGIIDINGLQVQTDDPTDQTTRYLVVYSQRQPEVLDIHDLITASAAINDIVSVNLITNDGLLHRAEVADVSSPNQPGTEWQVVVSAEGSDEVVEYVLYIDGDRTEYDEHDVYVVDGWPEYLRVPI